MITSCTAYFNTTVINFYDMMISRADFKFVAPIQENGEVKPEVQAATDFLNFCMVNMEDQTWQQFIAGIGTYRIYGFSIRTFQKNQLFELLLF